MTNYERAKELVDKILDLNHPDVFINDIEQALATAEREALERAARVAELEGVNSPNEAYEVACENVASLIRDVSIQVTQGVEGSGQGCKSQGADGKGAAETGLVPGLPTSASSKDLARDSAYRSSAARAYDNHAGVTTQTVEQNTLQERPPKGVVACADWIVARLDRKYKLPTWEKTTLAADIIDGFLELTVRQAPTDYAKGYADAIHDASMLLAQRASDWDTMNPEPSDVIISKQVEATACAKAVSDMSTDVTPKGEHKDG